MPTKTKKFKLQNIIELQNYMKIAIDEAVEQDEDGNYLINVGYLRVSTDKQADLGYGLDIQENAVVGHCKAHGFKNLLLFIDDGYTGTKMDRPALNGIISLINDFNDSKSNIKVTAFIVPRIDRLGRTLLGTLQFIQDYIVAEKDCKNSSINRNKESIQFASVAETYCQVDKNNPQGVFLLGLFSTLAEYDRDLIVQKLKAGRKARIASGKWMGGGNVPYGYRYDKELSKLVVIPEEAEKVREIFRLYIEEKMSPQRISDMLGFKGDRIITQILKRKSLTGCIVYNGEEYNGEHEAIISLSRWEEAQSELESRSVHRADSNYLLSGLLVCGECGAKMRYQKWGNQGQCKVVCYSQQSSKPNLVKDENCENEKYWADDIENAVIEQLFAMSYLGNADSIKSEAFVDPIETLTQQLKEVNRKLAKAYEFEEEDDDVLQERITTLRKLKKQLTEQINSENEKEKIIKKVGKARDILKNLESTFAKMTDKEKQSVCRELIDRVVVNKAASLEVHLKLKSFLIKKAEV